MSRFQPFLLPCPPSSGGRNIVQKPDNVRNPHSSLAQTLANNTSGGSNYGTDGTHLSSGACCACLLKGSKEVVRDSIPRENATYVSEAGDIHALLYGALGRENTHVVEQNSRYRLRFPCFRRCLRSRAHGNLRFGKAPHCREHLTHVATNEV